MSFHTPGHTASLVVQFMQPVYSSLSDWARSVMLQMLNELRLKDAGRPLCSRWLGRTFT